MVGMQAGHPKYHPERGTAKFWAMLPHVFVRKHDREIKIGIFVCWWEWRIRNTLPHSILRALVLLFALVVYHQQQLSLCLVV